MSSVEMAPIKTPNGEGPGGSSDVVVKDVVLDCQIKNLHYGAFRAVRDTAIPIQKNAITAFIGPSGCGKSTVLRCLNRMNDLVRGFRLEGHVRYRGKDIYHPTRSEERRVGKSVDGSCVHVT